MENNLEERVENIEEQISNILERLNRFANIKPLEAPPKPWLDKE